MRRKRKGTKGRGKPADFGMGVHPGGESAGPEIITVRVTGPHDCLERIRDQYVAEGFATSGFKEHEEHDGTWRLYLIQPTLQFRDKHGLINLGPDPDNERLKANIERAEVNLQEISRQEATLNQELSSVRKDLAKAAEDPVRRIELGGREKLILAELGKLRRAAASCQGTIRNRPGLLHRQARHARLVEIVNAIREGRADAPRCCRCGGRLEVIASLARSGLVDGEVAAVCTRTNCLLRQRISLDEPAEEPSKTSQDSPKPPQTFAYPKDLGRGYIPEVVDAKSTQPTPAKPGPRSKVPEQ